MTREEQIDKAALDYCGYDTETIYAHIENAFIAGAEWADSHTNWISVEDELPKINPNGGEWEFSDDVIVVLKDDSIAVGRYERDNSIGEHYWVLYGVDKDLVVTHWMPLLAPPHHFPDVNKMVKKGGEQ